MPPADIDPATWRPCGCRCTAITGCGTGPAQRCGPIPGGWIKLLYLRARQVVTSASAKDRWIALDGRVTHSHGPGGKHGPRAITRLLPGMDITLARIQAESIAAALQQRWPEHTDSIEAQLRELVNDLDALDRSYREQTAQLAGRDIIYSHPVYQYFEHRYQLPGRSLHWEPDAMPSDAQWAELEQMIDESSLFVWEGEPETAIGERMASLGLAWGSDRSRCECRRFRLVVRTERECFGYCAARVASESV